MATTLTVNGTDYSFPQPGEAPGWGSAVTNWATAVTSGMLQKAGGAFTLTAEVDFGATYGLKSSYYKSRGTNPASAGVIRLASAEYIYWRNAANDGDLGFRVNGSDVLEFNGNPIVSLALGTANYALKMNSGGTAYEWGLLANANIDASAAIVYSKLDLTGGVVNADVNASAAIAYSKLALTGSIVNADVSASAAIAYSKLSLTGGIVNADVNASAAIAYSKLDLSGSIVNADITDGVISFAKLSSSTCTVDEDNMASNSASLVPTQQSVKAYVDTQIASAADVSTLAASSPGTNQSFGSADESVLIITPTADIDVTLDNTYSSGRTITLINLATAYDITVKANDGSTIFTLYRESRNSLICQTGTPTTNTSWRVLEVITSPWISFTPNLTTVPGTETGHWKRYGDTITVRGRVDLSGAVTGTIKFEEALPSGSIDTTTFFREQVIGSVLAQDTGTSRTTGVITYDATNLVAFNSGGSPWAASTPFTWASSDLLGYEFRVALSGWTDFTG